MTSRDGFQPCETDTGISAPMPSWERNLVIAALSVHVVDVGLDLLVVLLFFTHGQWSFFFGAAGVILWSWLVSSLYISFGGGMNSPGDGIDDGPDYVSGTPKFLQSFVQVQIFVEAHRCIFRGGDTDYFHTLRLMEAILESAPSSLVKLYALIIWAGTSTAPEGASTLLQLSVLASFVSVGLGLAMWEQKVQFRTSSMYIFAVSVMRAFEIASRALTIAVFASLTHPYGIYWALIVDYILMLFLICRHQSVQFTYGLFVALPLVLVSLEPLVWRREDHAVPKDSYYMVRIIEAAFMWVVIFHQQELVEGASSDVYLGCEVLALLTTLGLYVTLPFVWCAARRHELSRDVTDWGDEEHQGLQGGQYTDSEGSGSDDAGGKLLPGE
eukprot:TRINITY_DN45545_c0_g1_i1.p1 TRINITY_DN45545_c0_g1~~TRINITY_DN45545_c0_g1_i1.p1  ORF type:complete len:384 (-),score=64.20 TRINITY_DN45545_c0_g1_i1:340-1491(-)